MCALVTGVQTCALPIFVPSVQSPPSMLKLHDFCNRAGKLRPCTGWNSSVGEDRMPNGMRCLDPSIADRITSLSTMRNNEEIFETFGFSYNTLRKEIGRASCRERVCTSV